MNRRNFLKNSFSALLISYIDKGNLFKTIESSNNNDPQVLLYLVQNKKNQWKVLGTKWIDIAKNKLDGKKYIIDSFKPLEIINNSKANKRRNELWKTYKCSGEKGGPLDILVSEQRAKKAHVSPKMQKYLKSEEWKVNWSKGKYASGKKNGKILGKRNVETGWIFKIRPIDYADNFKKFSKEEKSKYGKMGGKASAKVNLASGQIMLNQAKMAETRRKKVINIITGEIYVSAKECAKINNFVYGTFKNTLNENGRKNKTNFRYANDLRMYQTQHSQELC